MAEGNREYRRHMEAAELTVAQVAARGDTLRFHCHDCGHTKDIPARMLVKKHGHKLVSDLRPVCADCRYRRRRAVVGLHESGYGTWLEILWPDDRR